MVTPSRQNARCHVENIHTRGAGEGAAFFSAVCVMWDANCRAHPQMFYDDEPGTNKSYIKVCAEGPSGLSGEVDTTSDTTLLPPHHHPTLQYFNGKILPLANAGTSPAVAPCAAAATIHELLGQCPLITASHFQFYLRPRPRLCPGDEVVRPQTVEGLSPFSPTLVILSTVSQAAQHHGDPEH